MSSEVEGDGFWPSLILLVVLGIIITATLHSVLKAAEEEQRLREEKLKEQCFHTNEAGYVYLQSNAPYCLEQLDEYENLETYRAYPYDFPRTTEGTSEPKRSR